MHAYGATIMIESDRPRALDNISVETSLQQLSKSHQCLYFTKCGRRLVSLAI